MPGHLLDLIDPRHVELGLIALLPDHFRRRFRDHADFRHRLGGVGLNLEPDAKRVSGDETAVIWCGNSGDHRGSELSICSFQAGSIGTEDENRGGRGDCDARPRQENGRPMPSQTVDAIVLGAGIVGVSAALALSARGRSVALIDRLPRRRGKRASATAASFRRRASSLISSRARPATSRGRL